MPEYIVDVSDLKPGDYYEDGFFHPCLCLGVEEGAAWGISLIDGSYPRSADLDVGGVRKLSLEEVWDWKMRGPDEIAAEWQLMHPDAPT